MKKCNKCQEYRPLDKFSQDKRNSTGTQGICTPCKNEDNKVRREVRAAAGDYRIVSSKTCRSCSQLKSIDLFFKDRAMGDGHAAICKECKVAKTYAWRAANKEKYNKGQRDYQKTVPAEQRYGSEIKRRYGCDLEQYNAMLVAQSGACAICKSLHNPAEKKGRLYVDHDHSTGKVRALLCKHCNSMLGYALDKAETLKAAIAYLESHSKP